MTLSILYDLLVRSFDHGSYVLCLMQGLHGFCVSTQSQL